MSGTGQSPEPSPTALPLALLEPDELQFALGLGEGNVLAEGVGVG